MRRRAFLADGGGGATLSVSQLSTRAFGQAILERQGPSKQVIVVGAGLAGLCAAYELTHRVAREVNQDRM